MCDRVIVPAPLEWMYTTRPPPVAPRQIHFSPLAKQPIVTALPVNVNCVPEFMESVVLNVPGSISASAPLLAAANHAAIPLVSQSIDAHVYE